MRNRAILRQAAYGPFMCLILAASCMLAVSCVATGKDTPSELMNAYINALRNQNSDELRSLFDNHGMSEAEFETNMKRRLAEYSTLHDATFHVDYYPAPFGDECWAVVTATSGSRKAFEEGLSLQMVGDKWLLLPWPVPTDSFQPDDRGECGSQGNIGRGATAER